MKRFVKIPKIIFELNLTPLQLLVYAGIVSLKSKANYTTASAEAIAGRCNISRNSVYTAVNALKSVDLINKSNNIKNGKNTANGYYINNIGGAFIKLEYSVFKFNLSPSEFAAYLSIKSKCNHANRAFPSLKQIAELAHICIDTVIASVKKLANKGLLLFKHYMRRCGCFGHNNYIIIDEPEAKKTKHKVFKLITRSADTALKKAASLFLHKNRYSKFWATILDTPKNFIRKKILSHFNNIHIVNFKKKSKTDQRMKQFI